MTMKYEIEVKALLGSQENTDALLEKLADADPDFSQFDEQKQLNHYFKGGSLGGLTLAAGKYLNTEQVKTLKRIAESATSFSVRSREKNGTTVLVVKGSLDAASADHSHRRMEFEEKIDLPIEELDALIEEAGFELEAKWSAERRFFKFKDMTIDVFFSPGYGYLVEFEKVISDEEKVEQTRADIINDMGILGVKELDPERLNRMFAYYNAHWPEYYDTKNIFTIE